jgi:hypothetical protein
MYCEQIIMFLDISHRSALGSTQPLNRNEYQKSLKINKPGGKVRPACRADNLAAIYLLAVCLSNVGTLTSRNPMGLNGLQQGYLYLFTFTCFYLKHQNVVN